MKFYLAPMEGITGFIYRNAYEKYFGNIDKYFTPFIVPNQSNSLKTKEFRDVLPENNKGMIVVPQILTNDAEGFIHTTKKLMELGYDEVNLNLGCPSGTVVGKNRGSGFLALREELDKFLEEIYKMDNTKISIKTRIGKESPDEFYEIMNIYNKYPLHELIIHPRTQKDFYGNTPNLEMFNHGFETSNSKVCYNGDIFSVEGYEKITKAFPEVQSVMLGRGILANPGLVGEIKGESLVDKNVLKAFHDEIFNAYREVFNEDRNAIFRMKEFWGYMIHIFYDNKKYAKKIKKAQKLSDYNEAVNSLFGEQHIIKGELFK
ncbi:MAG: tRNA dihydrouridine synthase [Clostridium sp.]